jgi:hypothetical protein
MGGRFNVGRVARFSVTALLLAMTCVCGYFGGYRRGFLVGLQGGDDARLFTKEYAVRDLVIASNSMVVRRADFQSLIDLIHTSTAPETWAANGAGEGKVEVFAPHFSLFVTQQNAVHDEVAELLAHLRTAQNRHASK